MKHDKSKIFWLAHQLKNNEFMEWSDALRYSWLIHKSHPDVKSYLSHLSLSHYY